MTPTSPAGPAPSTRRHPGTAILLTIVLAVAAAGAYAYWAKGRGVKAEPVPPALQFSGEEVTRPRLQPMSQRIEFSGPLVAPRTAIVKAKAAGTLLELDVAEGQRVKAGQRLGRIDLAELQSKVEDRAAALASAEAMLAEAQRLHASNLKLADQHFISANALESSQARLDAARAQARSARAQLSGSRADFGQAALIAPIAGIVGKRHVVPGEKLSPEQPIFTVVDLGTLELAGNVATHEIALLEVGQPVAVTVEGLPKPVAGRIDRIAPASEAGTRAIGVVVVLANPGERLRAGQYAQALLDLPDATPRLTVPIAALGQASGQDQVWTIEKGALVRRIVVTGRRDVASGRIEVLSGLAPEATLLALRFDNLKEGARAEVVLAGPAAASASMPAGKS